MDTFEYDKDHDCDVDLKKMFIIACATETEQMMQGIDIQKLIDYFAQEKTIIKDVFPEWCSYGDVENYKSGISGDTLLSDNFYTALIFSLTDGKVTEWIRYGAKEAKKQYFCETLKNSVKEKFDYDIDVSMFDK